MAKLHVAAVTLLLVFGLDQAEAQIQVRPQAQDLFYRRSPERWAEVGSRPQDPVARGRLFDFAFAPDGLPVLASIGDGTVHLKKWDGRAWTRLTAIPHDLNTFPVAVKMASSRGGDIVVAVLSSTTRGSPFMRVFRLDGSELSNLGGGERAPDDFNGYAVAFDGPSPVYASQADGFVEVSRWSGTEWVQLGGRVNPRPIMSSDVQAPSLAVTADGRIVVAYASDVGRSSAISVRYWTGSRWVALRVGIPSPSGFPSLGGGNGGAPVMAFLNGRIPEVSNWNGSAWSVARRPCEPPSLGTNFGLPSLTVLAAARGTGSLSLLDQRMIVCGTDTVRSLGGRALVARIFVPRSGWTPLGTGPINGAIPLADRFDFAFVAHADSRGRPWVAWTTNGQDGPNIIVSTLVPADAPNP
jgi:hypothetical protein